MSARPSGCTCRAPGRSRDERDHTGAQRRHRHRRRRDGAGHRGRPRGAPHHLERLARPGLCLPGGERRPGCAARPDVEHPLDLLITDVGLPGLNGRQIAEIARQHRPDLKILFVTGYAEHAAGHAPFLARGMEMVTEPFALDALALKIREMLQKVTLLGRVLRSVSASQRGDQLACGFTGPIHLPYHRMPSYCTIFRPADLSYKARRRPPPLLANHSEPLAIRLQAGSLSTDTSRGPLHCLRPCLARPKKRRAGGRCSFGNDRSGHGTHWLPGPTASEAPHQRLKKPAFPRAGRREG